MASVKRSWSEENFSCSICLGVFSSPVSTPCGHNFFRTCINKFWDGHDQYRCPICNKIYHTRPDLQEVYEVKMAQLGKIEAEVLQMIQERKPKIKEIKDTVELSKKDANRERADGLQIPEGSSTHQGLDDDGGPYSVIPHPSLILSEDGKQVHDGGEEKELPDNSKRFTQCVCVLTRQSFYSGRFYFEVQVKDNTDWCLGLARISIDQIDETFSAPENGFWTIYFDVNGLLFNGDPDVRLPLRAELQKVGVFVDYDEGVVSFYDVAARVHIYSATGCTFSEPLYPFFYTYNEEDGINSAPLILSPVNQTE
ncbi:unnamed protein product [Boreogadus saida]